MSNRRSIADFPRNEAGLVDEFIGTAYDVVKGVYDNLDAIHNVNDQIEQLDELAEAAVEEAMIPARAEIAAGVDAAEAAATSAEASAVRANSINTQYPFTFVEGQALYNVNTISGLDTVNTSGMALWVEGALEYDFTINTPALFTINTPSAYADGTQMKIIINGHFDDTIKNLTDLQVSFEEEFQAFLDASGLEVPVAYAPGISVTRNTQVFTFGGDDYRANVAFLPFVTTDWATDAPKMELIGNDQLRQDIANGTDPAKGSALMYHLGRSVREALIDLTTIRTYGAVEGVSCTLALLNTAINTSGAITVPRGDYFADVTLLEWTLINALIPRLVVNGSLQINVAAGKYPTTVPTHVAKNSPGKLSLIGAPPVAMSILGQISVTGSAGAYVVTLGMNTVIGVEVGDWLHTYQVAGTGCPEVHRGCWEITAVDSVNNTLTVKNTIRWATFPTNTITSSTSKALKTILQYNNCDGIVVPTASFHLLDNVAVIGNSDTYWNSGNVTGTEKGTHGVYVGALTIALNGKTDNVNPLGLSGGSISLGPNVGISGFDQQGVCVELGGTVWGDFVTVTNCKRRGWYASTAAGIRAKHITGSGNFLDGAIVDIGGDLYSSSVSVFIGNGGRGCTASHAGTVVLDTGVVMFNLSGGGAAVHNGILQATSAKFNNNGSSGLIGEYGGVLVTDNTEVSDNAAYGVNCLDSKCRGLNMILNNNVTGAARATELGFINITGATWSGNGGGANPNTTRGGGMILTTAGYVVDIIRGTEFRVSPTGPGLPGVRIASTSSGDNMLLGSDTVGSGTYVNMLNIRKDIGVYAQTDNLLLLGRATERWKQIFAVDSVISTSDARHKTAVREFYPVELLAATELASYLGVYKWLGRVAEEEAGGDPARGHIGMTVQTAISVMAKYGLNPMEYGMICYDAWPDEFDEEGVKIRDAGDIYSFRLNELEMFMIAGQHHRLNALEARLN